VVKFILPDEYEKLGFCYGDEQSEQSLHLAHRPSVPYRVDIHELGGG
jgi:hypothetical protein